ncbi:sensor histidine kinase [Aeromicrobium sp. Root495]|uniref:sensor histidine kinase n=1 Tax=Aeromicrobium sp. Root495 TaxID=1736550 RepID=UPI001910ABF2|nr:ATP-binding protein [Aeromicrobium sp. Root495]
MVVKRTRLTLAGQVLVLQLVVIGVVLVIVGAISLRQSTSTFGEERGRAMRSVAEYLANIDVVRDRVDDEDAPRTLAPSVDRALRLSGATTVSIARADGEVVASSDPELVGTQARLGDSDVQQGRGWGGDLDVDGHPAVAGHAPVLSDAGDLIGLTIAEQRYPAFWDRLTDDATDLALFLGAGAALGVAGTWWVSRVLKRRTRGLGTAEIATLADHREALLHSIGEGVLAVDPQGRITVLNDSACELLGLRTSDVGRRVADLGLEPDVTALLAGHDDAHDAVALVGDRVIVVNRRPALSRGRGIGSVTTMRDRTELVSMQNQLSSNLSITDTLRAQTHEFANRIHTISGLVELEEHEELAQLLGTLRRERAELDVRVRDHVDDPAVAALLVGKASVAAEAGVRLTVTDDSHLPGLERSLSGDVTTVVGNLVDNAVDACRNLPDAAVEITLAVADGDVVVTVDDNGPGVPEEIRSAIFVRGFSTKPDVLGGRGIGLPLVRLIATRRGGTALIDDEAGRTRFVVSLPLVPGAATRGTVSS